MLKLSLFFVLSYIAFAQLFFSQTLDYKLINDFTVGEEGVLNDSLFIVSISDIAINKKGNIYALDKGANTIWVINESGEFITKIGREGKGPGELIDAHNIEIIYWDNIIIVDNGLRRFTIFDQNNKYKRSINFPEFLNIVRKFKVDDMNNILVESIEYKLENKEMITRTLLFRFDDNLNLLNKIDSSNYYLERMYFNEQNIRVKCPYPDKLIWDVLPNGEILVATAHSKAFKIYDADVGYKTIQINSDRSVISEADKLNFFKKNEFLQSDGSWGIGAPDYVKRGLKFPEYLPLFNTFIIDTNHNIILIESIPSNTKTKFLLYSFDGKYIKERLLPSNIFNQTTTIDGDHLYNFINRVDAFSSINRYSLIENR